MAATHVHGPDCGHVHAPDPRTLGDDFSWRDATLTVLAAGSRPCSGAILVLVFGLAQGMFGAGIAAVAAMSLGTAITTGALASLAVLAKGLALRATSRLSRRGLLVIRGLETAAAALVLVAGPLVVPRLHGARRRLNRASRLTARRVDARGGRPATSE